MSPRRRWCLGIAGVAVVLSGSPAGPARAATVEVGTSVEAWYATVPTTPVASRPPGTIHVGVVLGTEESRSYLSLDMTTVDAERVTGGQLRLPIDASSSRSPELAAIDVCLAGTTGPAVEGSTDDPPPADCSSSSPAAFDANGGQFVADLGPFTASLRTSGLALVPRAAAPTDTWHVAIWGAKSTSPDARPIRATLVLTDSPTGTPAPAAPGAAVPVVADERPTAFGGGEGNAFASASGLNLPVSIEPDDRAAAAAAPQLGAPDPAAVSTVGAPVANRLSSVVARFGASPPNSVAFALPLVLLALACYLASALTRPAAPARDERRRGHLPTAGARALSSDG